MLFFRTKQHYGNLFKQSQFEREIINKKQRRRADIVRNNNQEALMYVVFVLGGIFVFLLFQGKSEYDIDNVSENKAKETEDK